jgi:nitronate monooxygenase
MPAHPPTALTSLLGIDHPIILAPMAGGVSTPELAAAVSNAGGLGSLGVAYLSPADITAAIDATRRLTPRPFAANLFAGGWTNDERYPAPSADDLERMRGLLAEHHARLGLPAPTLPAAQGDPFPAQLDAVLEARVPIVSFTFGIPSARDLARCRAQGAITIGTATTVAEARALAAAGIDAIAAQGSEAGAHRGTFLGAFEQSLVGTMALVPQIVDAVDVPVIASGGIMDGRGIVAAQALGAAGVQLGTAFLVTDESGAREIYKRAVRDATDDATRVTRAFSGRPARGIVNRFMREVEQSGIPIPRFPVQNTLTRQMRGAGAASGDADVLSLWAGQAAALARSMPAGELVATLVREAAEVARTIAR